LIQACHEFISLSQIPGFLEPRKGGGDWRYLGGLGVKG
jgi:hypothetical protein